MPARPSSNSPTPTSLRSSSRTAAIESRDAIFHLLASAYWVAGLGSWFAGSDSPRKGSLNLREISGQNWSWNASNTAMLAPLGDDSSFVAECCPKKLRAQPAVRLVAPFQLSRKVSNLPEPIWRHNVPLGFVRHPKRAVKASSFAVQFRGATAVKLAAPSKLSRKVLKLPGSISRAR